MARYAYLQKCSKAHVIINIRKNRGETSMEKNRISSVKTGKSMRMSFQRQKEVLEMPDLIEVQKDSYKWFLREGLKEVFDDISPIADYGGKLSLEFIDFTFDEKDAKYSIEQCKERDVTYAAPLKVRVKMCIRDRVWILNFGDCVTTCGNTKKIVHGARRRIYLRQAEAGI